MLARKYVDLIGASLAMSSSPGKGSVFTISFPPAMEAQLDGGVAAPVAGAAGSAASPRRRGARRRGRPSLVVEDQPDQALFMRALLQNRYEVAVAANAGETLALLAESGATRGADSDGPGAGAG